MLPNHQLPFASKHYTVSLGAADGKQHGRATLPTAHVQRRSCATTGDRTWMHQTASFAIMCSGARLCARASRRRRREICQTSCHTLRAVAEIDSLQAQEHAISDVDRRFLEWAKAAGIWISPKLRLPAPTPRGRGVLAVSDVLDDEVIFRVPRSAALVETLEAEFTPPPTPALRDFWARWGQPEARLAARLLFGSVEQTSDQDGATSGDSADSSAADPVSTADSVWRGPLASYYLSLRPGVTTSRQGLTSEAREAASRLGVTDKLKTVQTERVTQIRRITADLKATKIDGFGDPRFVEDVEVALNAAYSRSFLSKRKPVLSDMFTTTFAGLVVSFILISLPVLQLFQSSAVDMPPKIGAALGVVAIFALLANTSLVKKASFVVLPAIDMVNHARGVPLKLEFDEDSDSWNFKAGRDFAAGEEIVFDYSKTPDDLLINYGFVESA